MRKYIPTFDFSYFVKVTILFIVYFLTAKLGLSFYAVHGFATSVWPPTGIALAALILYGYDLWPAILLGAFLVNSDAGAHPAIALAIAVGNTLEALVGTYLLRKYVTLFRCFERLPDTLYFIGIVVVVGAGTSATIGVTALWMGGVIGFMDAPATWITWWIGDALGALVITPFLLTHLAPTRPYNADSLKKIEIVGGYIFLIFSSLLIFWYPIGDLKNTALLYLILFPLIWSGIRFGSRGITLSILVTSIIAVVSTAYGRGPFMIETISDSLLYLQIFLGTISVTFLIFISIVKERKLSMEKLEEHVNELEHAIQKVSSSDRAKNDFLAILSHELRNPLAPILSSLEIMKMKTEKNSETQNLVKTIETHTYTVSRLLDDLLDISRINRKKFKLEKETVSIQEVISQSVAMAEPGIRAKNHTLILDVPEETVWLVGDPLRLEQIIVNLLVNSTKYTDPGGTITITCRVEEDIVIVSIKDTGIGINSDMLKRIFEPFLQGDKNDSRSGGGMGIGLSLTKRLVELHNGNIVARSDGKGLGSEFVVTLPIPQTVQLPMQIKSIIKEDSSETSNEHSAQNQKYRILVVDDNVSAAEGVRELLRYKGHTVESIYDGPSALEIMENFLPDVVILDIGLPSMDGYEVAEKIRDTFPEDIVLIALTGYGQDEDKIKAYEAGFNHHLTKPTSISDIEKILTKIST